jgi:hypothetical protein
MRWALPSSEYYDSSAPPRPARPTVDPAQPAALDARWLGRTGTVPVFTAVRSTKEEPDSAPAASPRVRRRLSPQPPGHRLHSSRKFPNHQQAVGDALLPARIHQVGAGKALRGFTPPVPRVLLSVPLTGPTPSGGTGAPRLCQGCSHPPRHLPGQAALSSYPAAATAGRRWSLTSTQTTAPHGARRPHSTPSTSPPTAASTPAAATNSTTINQQRTVTPLRR